MNVLYRLFNFYRKGFSSMSIGKTLWVIILVKLFIMFGIIKLFFFPNVLNKYETEQDKAEYIIEQLIDDRK